MIRRSEIIGHLKSFLKTDEFEDYCVNGIQVEGKDTIQRIITGVSVSQQIFQSAVDCQADMIIVHHGLFWKNQPIPFSLTGIMKKRVKLLLENDINLASYHLPLDTHPVIGNNAQILRHMGLPLSEPFDVGYLSRLNSPLTPTNLKTLLDRFLPDASILFGETGKPIITIAVVSGGGSGMLQEAACAGVDALITGDVSEPAVRIAEELGICLIRSGHYNSERFGPRALSEHLGNRFNIPVEFVDVPNSM